MGAYSVMVPDNNLIKAVKGFNRLAIVGCEGCANGSLAYDKNVPQRAVFDEHRKQYKPAPDLILEEGGRLKAVLKNTVQNISVTSGMGLCSNSTSDKQEEWIEICSGAEAVLVLSCAAGILGVKQALEKSIKVISGMRTVGVLYSFNIFDSDKGLLYLDKARSAVIRFTKSSSDLDKAL